MILSLTVRYSQRTLHVMAIVSYITDFSALAQKNDHPSKVVKIILHVPKNVAFIWSTSSAD